MSDLYFSNVPADVARLDAIEGELGIAPCGTCHRWVEGGVGAIATRAGDARLWAPLHDSGRGVVLAVHGRPVLEPADVASALAQDRGAGALSRMLYHRYLAGGSAALAAVNGAFALILVDLRAGTLLVQTDRTGIFALYEDVSVPRPGLRLCSHPDALARHAAGGHALDAVTLAEVMRCGRAVSPYTFYEAVRELPSGTTLRIDLRTGEAERSIFWTPDYEPCDDERIVADDLAHAIGRAVRRRAYADPGRTGVFLSGGADSRTALFACADPSNLLAVTLADGENCEVRVARQLAVRAGVEHEVVFRDADYYPRAAPRTMALACGMWNYQDGHFVQVAQALHEAGVTHVLTGCYADMMLKGLMQNRRRIRIGPLQSSLYRRTPFALAYSHLWTLPIARQWLPAVESRLWEEVGGREIAHGNDHADLAIEGRRLFPLSRSPATASRSALWRLIPWEPWFVDSDVLEVYRRITPRQKLNGTVFGHAVRELCRAAADIPNANSGLPIGAGLLARALNDLVPRRVAGNEAAANGVGGNGSWPDWTRVIARSPTIRETWQAARADERALVIDLVGFDPWKRPLASWSTVRDGEMFNRMYSLLVWNRVRQSPPTLARLSEPFAGVEGDEVPLDSAGCGEASSGNGTSQSARMRRAAP